MMKQPLAEDLRLEYGEGGENLRWYGDARLKLAALFVTMAAALAAGGLQFDEARVLARATGMSVTPIFLVTELRYAGYWYAYLKRAQEIEDCLGLNLYHRVLSRGLITSENAARLLMIASYLFWIALIRL